MRFDPTTTPPKLSLFSLPKKPYDEQNSAGLSTPPIHTLASVPFEWEEAPGKPKPNHHLLLLHQPKSKASRCLNLPPRLLHEFNTINNKVNSISSPTTLTDDSHYSACDDGGDNYGHHQSLSRSRSLSFEKGTFFSRSSRWGSFRRRNNNDNKKIMKKKKEGGDGGDVEFSSLGFDGNDGDVNNKVKITRIKRQSSLLPRFSSPSTSLLLTNIYQGIKQVIPWRRKERN